MKHNLAITRNLSVALAQYEIKRNGVIYYIYHAGKRVDYAITVPGSIARMFVLARKQLNK